MIRYLKWLSVIATFGMIFVLLGGALVTKTDSGAGCGDSWPLCHGQLIPSEITLELVIELSHRLVSGIVGIVVLALSFFSWKHIGHIREVKFLSFMSFFFLVLQGLIGAAAVIWGQSDFVLALHFGISLISFAAIFLLTLLIFEIDKKFDADSLFIKKKHRIEIYMLAVYTYLVVYTGALVRHTSSELVCPSWPFCTNSAPFSFLSTNQMELWVQMGHRLAAGILFVWTIIFAFKLLKQYQSSEIYMLAVYTYLVVYTGALVRHTSSELVCPSWPFCTNSAPFSFLSTNQMELWVQMGHRLAAGILFVWTIIFAFKLLKQYQSS